MLVTIRRFGAPTVALVCALALTSCGKIVERAFEEGLEEAVERDSGEDVEIDFDNDGSLSITGDDGEFNFSVDEDEGALFSGTDEDGNDFSLSATDDFPDDWPGEIPAPPGSVVGSTVMSDNSLSFISIVSQVDNAIDAQEAYVAQLTGSGFTVGSEAQFSNEGEKTSFVELSSSMWNVSVTASEGTESQMIVTLQETIE